MAQREQPQPPASSLLFLLVLFPSSFVQGSKKQLFLFELVLCLQLSRDKLVESFLFCLEHLFLDHVIIRAFLLLSHSNFLFLIVLLMDSKLLVLSSSQSKIIFQLHHVSKFFSFFFLFASVFGETTNIFILFLSPFKSCSSPGSVLTWSESLLIRCLPPWAVFTHQHRLLQKLSWAPSCS